MLNKIKVYLDNCAFNRPFDDQTQIRIHVETEAKLYIQQAIEKGELLLAWSYILDYENAANLYEFRKTSIIKWKKKAYTFVEGNDEVLNQAKAIKEHGVKAKDALHIASAVYAECSYFITTDDDIINKNEFVDNIDILNPVEMIKIIEEEL